MNNKQLILVEFNNAEPFIYKIISSKKITIEKVAKYFIETEGFNEERDSITFLDQDITEINI